MLKLSSKNLLIFSAIFVLSACSWFQQPAASVINGSNPYSPTDAVNTALNQANTAANQAVNTATTAYQNATLHTVTTGDTLYGIARKYGTNVETLKAINGLPDNNVKIGQQLKVIGTATSLPTTQTNTQVANPVVPNAPKYTVQQGDTLYSIARKHQVSAHQLKSWNGLNDTTANNLRVGQVLNVKPTVAATAAATAVAAKVATTKPTTSAKASSTAKPTNSPSLSANEAQTLVKTKKVDGITWQKPTAGLVVTSFKNTQNQGVVFNGAKGSAVYAAADGVVESAGSDKIYGKTVRIKHSPAYTTLYGNNATLLVKKGETVQRGQTIATMNHAMQYQVIKNGVQVNPASYIVYTKYH